MSPCFGQAILHHVYLSLIRVVVMQGDHSKSSLVRILEGVLPESVLLRIVDKAQELADSPNYWMTKVADCAGLDCRIITEIGSGPCVSVENACRKQYQKEGPISLQQKRPSIRSIHTSTSSCQTTLLGLSTGFRSTLHHCSAEYATLLVVCNLRFL